jgi:hypothetical protein
VGNGNDFSAEVTSGTISQGEGAFAAVFGVASETDATVYGANDFSLQLNSQLFTSPACSGGDSSCRGWQQFVYSSLVVPGAFMQYWLINYQASGAPCPTGGWASDGAVSCYTNSSLVPVPDQSISNLRNLTLTGTASTGGADTLVMSTGSELYSVSNEDSVLGLAAGWQVAEFNIVGDCCLSEATFNSGTTLVVKTSVENHTTNAPSCSSNGFTGETNSLTLVPLCCPYGGAAPGIVFMESSVSHSPTPTCQFLEHPKAWLSDVLRLLTP